MQNQIELKGVTHKSKNKVGYFNTCLSVKEREDDTTYQLDSIFIYRILHPATKNHTFLSIC